MFVKSHEYFSDKIQKIKDAIRGTEENIPSLTQERQKIAHIGQIETYKKELLKTETEFMNWQNNTQNKV